MSSPHQAWIERFPRDYFHEKQQYDRRANEMVTFQLRVVYNVCQTERSSNKPQQRIYTCNPNKILISSFPSQLSEASIVAIALSDPLWRYLNRYFIALEKLQSSTLICASNLTNKFLLYGTTERLSKKIFFLQMLIFVCLLLYIGNHSASIVVLSTNVFG